MVFHSVSFFIWFHLLKLTTLHAFEVVKTHADYIGMRDVHGLQHQLASGLYGRDCLNLVYQIWIFDGNGRPPYQHLGLYLLVLQIWQTLDGKGAAVASMADIKTDKHHFLQPSYTYFDMPPNLGNYLRKLTTAHDAHDKCAQSCVPLLYNRYPLLPLHAGKDSMNDTGVCLHLPAHCPSACIQHTTTPCHSWLSQQGVTVGHVSQFVYCLCWRLALLQ